MVKNMQDLRYIDLEDNLFWATSCEGFAFGSVKNSFAIPNLLSQFI